MTGYLHKLGRCFGRWFCFPFMLLGRVLVRRSEKVRCFHVSPPGFFSFLTSITIGVTRRSGIWCARHMRFVILYFERSGCQNGKAGARELLIGGWACFNRAMSADQNYLVFCSISYGLLCRFNPQMAHYTGWTKKYAGSRTSIDDWALSKSPMTYLTQKRDMW